MTKITDTVKNIASAWQRLSAKDRQKYHNAARQGKSYLFYKNYGSDRKRYEHETQLLNRQNLRKPKKCLSAYMIFVREVSSKQWVKKHVDEMPVRSGLSAKPKLFTGHEIGGRCLEVPFSSGKREV